MRFLVIALVMLFSVNAPAAELDMLPLGDPGLAYELGSTDAGSVYDCATGASVEFDELVARLIEADVVLLGEEHTAMDQKLFHARLVDAMASGGGRLVLAMEFFLRGDQEALDRWSSGEIGDRELLEATGWYDRGGYRWEYYRPVMETARRRGVRVVGANVPREIPRAVNRGGLDGLSDDQRAEIGDVTTDGSPQHRYLISRYFGDTVAMLPPGWFDNMYAAQCLWDVVMARSVVEAHADDTTVVLVVGSGHVAYGLGIPRRIDEELEVAGLSPLDVVSFCPATAPAPDPDGEPTGHPMGNGHEVGEESGPPAQFSRSLADYVGGFADRGGIEAFPTIGLRLKEDDEDRPVVSMVWPDTLAETVGFASGDLIVDVNGVAPSSLSDLRFMLATIEWGQRLGVRVQRGDELLEIAALLYPTTDTTESSTAPGYEIDAIGAIDPESSVVVAELVAEDAPSRWTRVRADRGSDRVELRSELLDEVHELGEGGRVARSLYRVPLDDGIVERRYERDAAGAVMRVLGFDRTGTAVD